MTCSLIGGRLGSFCRLKDQRDPLLTINDELKTTWSSSFQLRQIAEKTIHALAELFNLSLDMIV